ARGPGAQYLGRRRRVWSALGTRAIARPRRRAGRVCLSRGGAFDLQGGRRRRRHRRGGDSPSAARAGITGIVAIFRASGSCAFALRRTSSLLGVLNMSAVFGNRPDLVELSWRSLIALYEQGSIRPVISRRFRLEDAAEAHRLLESRATVGKLVLDL